MPGEFAAPAALRSDDRALAVILSTEFLAIIGATFLLAGFVKGFVGFGLPTVALALLTVTIGLKEAMALMVIPAILTNIWQASVGGSFQAVLRRLWPFIVMMFLGAWVGGGILVRSDQIIISGVLGVLLLIYSAVSLITPQVPTPGRREIWMAPVVGGITGVVTGLTGTFVMPGALYLQALALPRDVFVQAMGIMFGMASVALAVSLSGHGLLTMETGGISAAGIVPALVGMAAGRWARQRLSDRLFRQFFFSALIVLGVYLVGRALLQ